MSTPPKPFAFTSGVTMLSSSAIFSRSSSTVFLAIIVALDHEFDRVRRILDRVLQPLDDGAQEALHRLRVFGGELRIDDDGVAVEVDAVVGHQHDDDVVAGTPIDFRLMKDENEKPVMASTLPLGSIGSRTGKPTFSILTLEASMPFACTKIFHCA